MEAKDTVMEKNQIKDVILKHYCSPETTRKDISIHDHEYEIVEAQAEISFKAGREEEHKELEEAIAEGIEIGKVVGKQAGIREAVECIEEMGLIKYSGLISRTDWQAKLKEWGIQ